MRVTANALQIEVDVQGPPGAPPLLLIMGMGMQLVGWWQGYLDALLAQGLRIIRFDNRDAGLSDGVADSRLPPMWQAALRHHLRLPALPVPYTLADMAADALGVLDALGVSSAHVCGASMGGMIGQHLAARHGARVRSLSLLMSSSGARHLPPPTWRVQRAMLARPRRASFDALVDYKVRFNQLIGSPGYPIPLEMLRARQVEAVGRAWRPEGTARQLLAVLADGDRSALLRQIRTPTLVVHGLDDPLVPVPAGRDLAAKIAGAQLELVPGMGHNLPPGLWTRLAKRVADHVWAAERARGEPAPAAAGAADNPGGD